MRHIIPISGKDSLATAVVQMNRQSYIRYEYLFNPTGADLPETLAWLKRVEQYLGKSIVFAGGDLPSIIQEQGILPSQKARYCTRLAKIYPMEDYLGSDECIIYYGIRADENRVGYQSGAKQNLHPVYPLVEAGYTLPMVWELLESIDLLPPQFFWQSVYDLVLQRLTALGFASLLDTLKAWEKAALFAWRSRSNCHFCFNQRLYEWAGLHEFHPELFWQNVELEETTGAKDFTFKRYWPLRKIAEKAESIKRKRAKDICKMLLKRAQAESLFALLDDDSGIEEPDFIDMLAITSCGLLCGK